MRLTSITISAALLLLGMSSCGSPEKVPYFVGANEIPSDSLNMIATNSDPVLSVGDLLNIEVTGINMTAMAPFNKGKYVDTEGKIGSLPRTMTSNIGQYSGLEVSTEYYLVNADGTIDFPIVGKIPVAGHTKAQVAEEITDAIYPKYLTEKPAVDIRLMNFRVTVAGAVKNPGIYQSKNERMTFLEAISMAGDLDIKGDREDILLFRTNPDGKREVHTLNSNDKNFLLSPYYVLQQNDYIYVAPNKSMRRTAWQLDPAVTATISVVGGASSLASLIVGIINLSK